MRAFSIGATTVFTSVCPVLKSLPQMGTSLSWARSTSARMSTVKLGCLYSGGLFEFDLGLQKTTVIAKQRSTVCGERAIGLSDSVIASSAQTYCSLTDRAELRNIVRLKRRTRRWTY